MIYHVQKVGTFYGTDAAVLARVTHPSKGMVFYVDREGDRLRVVRPDSVDVITGATGILFDQIATRLGLNIYTASSSREVWRRSLDSTVTRV